MTQDYKPDFRALCAELLQELEHASDWDYQQALKDQARAALAQPEPVAAPSAVCTGCGTPRHEAISVIAAGSIACCPDCSTLTVEDRNAIRKVAALAQSEPQGPVPITERLPGPEDCDAEGRCWVISQLGNSRWNLDTIGAGLCFYTHWLPHHALPLPQKNEY
jgi:hypothetical protein